MSKFNGESPRDRTLSSEDVNLPPSHLARDPIFIDNKYTRTYYDIVNAALTMNREKSDNMYLESHHIIPKSLGGSNKRNNKVNLTVKEHYLCHRLLCYMLSDTTHKNKMQYALFMFSKSNKSQSRSISKHQLLKAIEANREASAKRSHKPNQGNKHSVVTKRKILESSSGRKHSQETIDKIRKNNEKTNESRGNKVRASHAARREQGIGSGKKSEEHRRKISESLKARNAARKAIDQSSCR